MEKAYCILIRNGVRTIKTIPERHVVKVATVLIPEKEVLFEDIPRDLQPQTALALKAAGFDTTGEPIE